MSLWIDQWRCEEFDEWWQVFDDDDCCRWNQNNRRCNQWWEDHPELLGDIGQGRNMVHIIWIQRIRI